LTAPVRALIEPYKFFDGVRIKEKGALQFEMNLQDDYIKFVRLSEATIQIADTGLIGLICNRGFLDNPTLRGMRWSLSATYSSMSFLDLRGHQSTMDDGSPDENVFDIKQGVAIAIALRSMAKTKSPSRATFAAFVGPREQKYRLLSKLSSLNIKQEELQPKPPLLKFVPSDSDLGHEFAAMVSLTELFPRNGAGFISSRDGLVVGENKNQLEQSISAFGKDTDNDLAIYERYGFGPSKRLDLRVAQRAVRQDGDVAKHMRPCLYRPFDQRWVYYKRELIESFKPIAFNFSIRGNIALLATRQVTRSAYEHAFVSRCMGEIKVCSHDRNTQIFPLFLKASENELAFSSDTTPNLNPVVLEKLAKSLGLKLNADSCELGKDGELSPLRLFHFTYAILHCPTYRERYFEFLRSDFPRLPLTGNLELFRTLARLGGELTALHLLESPKLDKPRTKFIGNSREVEKVGWVDDTVWINAGGKKAATTAGTSGFQGVPENVWNFHIGGYQVCEKWLKDRKGRTLTDDDIAHYHKIVIALAETIRLMAEIDEVINKHGGWSGAFCPKA
jgi:predicted helicase